MNIHQWRSQIKKFNESFENHTEIREQWEKHSEQNLHRLNKKNSIWNLEDAYFKGKEKAMILVGASPCLKDDVHKLHDIDDNFCIVCANSSLKFLLRNGITPKYCIALDADDIDIPQHLDVDTDEVTLLASTAVAPKALDQWKGSIYYMPYYSVSVPLRRKIRYRLGKGIPGGGNSMTQAFYVVTVLFGSKTVIFVANEYCFDSKKNYYADTKAAKQEKLTTLYPAVDVLGRNRWTLPAHYNYVIWQEKVCKDLSPPGYFIDTSFGLLGKDCDKIHHMELSEAIEKVKHAFEMRDILNSKDEKERVHILEKIRGQNEQSDVYRYNMHEQRERIMQLVRS